MERTNVRSPKCLLSIFASSGGTQPQTYCFQGFLLSGPSKIVSYHPSHFKTEPAGLLKGSRTMVIATICPLSPNIGTTGDGRTLEPGYLQHEQKASMVPFLWIKPYSVIFYWCFTLGHLIFHKNCIAQRAGTSRKRHNKMSPLSRRLPFNEGDRYLNKEH